MRFPRHLTLEMLERIIADALLVNMALVVALLLRFLSLFVVAGGNPEPSADVYEAALRSSIDSYRTLAPLLTAICLVSFLTNGFYTYGRAYRKRYKMVVVLQAVASAYLVFAAIAYAFLPGSIHLPRSVWIVAWLLTLVLVGGLRLCADLWRSTVWAEARIWGRPKPRTLRTILVIGGAGYIGSVLVRKLLDRGYYVTVLDALVYGDRAIRDLYEHERFEFIYGDLRDIEAVTRALQYADAVVHLGALVGDPACALDEKLTVEINLAATRMIAEAARGAGIQRYIFASTCSVYGASDETLDERSALNPVSLYARSKIASERTVLALNSDRFATTVLRFATVYGLSPRPRFDLVVNTLAAQAVCERSISIFGGSQWRPFVHVDDVAEAIVHCLQAPRAVVQGEVFNVGSDEQNYQILQLGDLMQQLIPGVRVVRNGDDQDRRNYRVSFGKIRSRLGFVPRRTVADGILEVKSAIESGAVADFRAACYSNYKTLCDTTDHLIRRTRMTSLYGGVEEEEVASLAGMELATTP